MQFYANPYNTDVNGFCFETYDEFEEGVEKLEKEYGFPVEEFSIDTVDGTREELLLVEAMDVDQGNLKRVLDVIENMDESYWPKLYFLLYNFTTLSLKDAVNKINDVCIHQETLHDAAEELFDDIFIIPNEIRDYIDYEKFAQVIESEGSMVEFEFADNTYTCTNIN